MKIFKKMTKLDKIVFIAASIAIVYFAISFMMDVFHEPEDSYVNFDNPYVSIEDSYVDNIEKIEMMEIVEINNVVNVYYMMREDDSTDCISGLFHDIFFKVDNQYFKVVGEFSNLEIEYIFLEDGIIRIIYLNIYNKHNISIDTTDFEDIKIIDSYGNSGTRVTNDLFSQNIFVYDKLDEDYHITIGKEVVYFYPELIVVKQDLE